MKKTIIFLLAVATAAALPALHRWPAETRLQTSDAPEAAVHMHQPKGLPHFSATPATNLLPRLCGWKAPSPQAAPVNTDSLQQSDWYRTVMADIEKKSYGLAAGPDGSVRSINVRQQLATRYNAGGFTLTPLTPLADGPGQMPKPRKGKDAWQLRLKVKGLYVQGKLACKPNEKAPARLQENGVDFRASELLTVQYRNSEAGVRQNFIVEQAPAGGAGELRVALQASEGWVVHKAAAGELHFARRAAGGALSTRVIYKDLKAWDANGRALAAHMEKEGGVAFALVVDVAAARYPVTIDPLSTTAAATLIGPSSGSSFGYSVASAGDVNGDGYSDVVVGSSGVSSNTGSAYVYYGSSTGLSTTAATTLTGPSSGSNFGASVASAGDVNGDGYSDVVVGAYGISSNTGSAYVYHGSSTGLSTTAATTFAGSSSGSYFGISVAAAGDVNGDGYSDVVVGAYGVSTFTGKVYIYHGSSTGLSTTAAAMLTGPSSNSCFGASVASAGDVNGDGCSDVVVGAYATTNGNAYVYHGSSTGLSTTAAATFTGPSSGSFFGRSVACAGDVNGDGYSDVVVGASAASSYAGAAYVYHGSFTGLSATAATILAGPSSNSYFGRSVASAGDVNGDGYSDVVVGAYGFSSSTGRASIYHGSSTGLSTTAAATLAGPSSGSYFGWSVAAAGDVNGDGYSDVVVGAYQTSNGSAYLYHGSAGSVQTASAATYTGSANSNFGYSVAAAGDVNGDGYSDVVVGAYGISSNTGSAYLYHGSSTGLSTTAAATLTGPSSNSRFGYSVAAAGDVNGDGYSDVVVGAYGFSSNTGSVYLYHGSSTGLSTTAATTLTGPSAGSNFGYSVAAAGDVNGDGYSDVVVGTTNNDNAYVYHGSSTGLSTTAAATLTGSSGSNFGASVAAAGDVNGDGYSDVVVGAYQTSNGNAYVYHGSSTGLSTTAAATLTGSSGSYFGASVAAAGDVNGDGYSDVVIGAYRIANGSASIYYGSSTGLSTTAAATLTGSSNSRFGISVASAGDVNGDGYSDVVIGAYGVSASTGSAYIYHGSSTGLSTTAAATLTGPSTNSRFGYSVASAGDVNGDGYSDVVVGAYGTTNGNTYLYPGNSGYGKRNNQLRLYETDLSTPLKQTNRSATQFGAGLFVRPFAGATKARLVWEVEKNGDEFMHNSPITNYTGYTDAQPGYTAIPPAGTELKQLINKISGNATKVRVRVQYLSTVAPGGQVFGPWIYPQLYLTGAMASGVLYGLPGQPLPVKLLGFTATNAGEGRNRIDWATATEDGAYRFNVERSNDGRTFSAIGAVEGNGSPSAYTFYDEQPLNPINYYRLKMTGAGGAESYSSIATVRNDRNGGTVTVAPIPAGSSIRITNTDASLQGSQAVIMDMQGSVMHTFVLDAVNTLDISPWPAGIYSLKLATGDVVRMVKQ